VLHCTRRSLSLLKKQGGKIINIASVEVFSHSRKLTAYAASKGALASLSRTLAVELGPQNICVNYICPGFIRTEMTQPYSKRWLFRKFLERQTPLGRMGEPEDVARAAVFLASEDSNFITGVGITVDGGLTLRSI
jgi:3-oxoacyl-[acyl-carrier protein] reductase